MVTGKLPFDGDSAVAIAMKHLKDTPVEPKSLVSSIPQGLNDIIMKAMQKEVASRYMSAREIYNDLQKVLKDPNITSVGINGKDSTFATQRVPPINSSDTIKTTPVRREVKNVEESGERKVNTKKNKKRKSNPIVKALTLLLVLILFLGGCVFIGIKGYEFLMGSDKNTEKVIVPNLIGYNEATARKMVESLKCVFEVIGEVDSGMPKGYIAKQKYPSGEMIDIGTTITVSLSSGPKKVRIPDLVGLSEAAAKIKLQDLGLEVEVKETTLFRSPLLDGHPGA